MPSIRTIALTLALLCTGPAAAEPVNVNTASAEEIAAALKGVGPNKAAAIVAYREKHGPYKAPEDLARVKGIGEKTVADNRADILLK